MDRQTQARNAGNVSNYTPSHTQKAKTDIVRFAVIGDSITEANSPDIGRRQAGNESWVYYAQSDVNRFAGGWAEGGATTHAMAENAEPIKAQTLVIVAGTNDVGQNIPFEKTASNLAKIVDKTGVKQVIVSSAPPRDDAPESMTDYNRQLQEYTKAQGWQWIDAAAKLRDNDVFADGLSKDGIHPTQQGAKLLGDALQGAINR